MISASSKTLMSTTTSPSALERVHVVEAEVCIGLERPGRLAGGTIEEREPCSELRLPPVVLDVRPATQGEAKRVDHERELGEHEPALGEPERVHVGGLAHRHPRDHLGSFASGRRRKKRYWFRGPSFAE